ncbi:MAG: SsrA-binding protein SmpB [Planctomycetota bacterium]|nr:MAG: SsrA-binding protein SmpB [Planctomycetota bacterium]
MTRDPGQKTPIARNRRAFHDFEILEKVEAGLVLQGTEVKSLRAGNVSFNDAHARVRNGEVWLHGLHIAPYACGNSWSQHEPTRPRKLLLRKSEIRKLSAKVDRQGLTLVPLDLYFRRGYAKLTLGVGRGRKKHDKRQALREKQDKLAMAREARRR